MKLIVDGQAGHTQARPYSIILAAITSNVNRTDLAFGMYLLLH